MSDLVFALSFGALGTYILVRPDRLAASYREAYRRWPVLRRFPILGRGHDSERFQRRLVMFDAVLLLAMSVVYLIAWVVSR